MAGFMTVIEPTYDYITGERIYDTSQSANYSRQLQGNRYHNWKNSSATADASQKHYLDMGLQPHELELFRSKLERDRAAAIEKERERRGRDRKERRENGVTRWQETRGKRGKKNTSSKWSKKKKRD